MLASTRCDRFRTPLPAPRPVQTSAIIDMSEFTVHHLANKSKGFGERIVDQTARDPAASEPPRIATMVAVTPTLDVRIPVVVVGGPPSTLV